MSSRWESSGSCSTRVSSPPPSGGAPQPAAHEPAVWTSFSISFSACRLDSLPRYLLVRPWPRAGAARSPSAVASSPESHRRARCWAQGSVHVDREYCVLDARGAETAPRLMEHCIDQRGHTELPQRNSSGLRTRTVMGKRMCAGDPSCPGLCVATPITIASSLGRCNSHLGMQVHRYASVETHGTCSWEPPCCHRACSGSNCVAP